MSKHLGLNRTADKLLKQIGQFDKLREIANKKNYPYKIKQVHAKVLEQYNFWNAKNNSDVLVNATEKLLDLKKDLNFIESQLKASTINKDRIDELAKKYDISYGKSNRSIY